jgi:ribosomal protein RSM22 (predicted rRNA methylase)
MLTATLPPALEQAVAEQIGSGARRAGDAAVLSERYRDRGGPPGPVAISAGDVLAYAAVRLPATYAAVRVVLGEAAVRVTDFAPASQLDLGAGPGTALWAAADVWPSIRERVAVEASREMARLGRELGADADWVEGKAPSAVPAGSFDLVTVSYLLGELTEADRRDTVERGWAAAAGALAVVEPGTTAGYERVLAARDRLVALGGAVVAPCPHDRACPLAGSGDWCHFAVRVGRTRAHRAAKRARLGHEDEKLSYVVVAREPVAGATARVLRRPQIRSGHVLLELCTPEGLRRETVSKRDRDRYRRARTVSWGEDLDTGEPVVPP